jgi:hypothetical protein
MIERTAYVERVGALLSLVDLDRESICERLEEYGIVFANAEHVIDAVNADAEDAANCWRSRSARHCCASAAAPPTTTAIRWSGPRTAISATPWPSPSATPWLPPRSPRLRHSATDPLKRRPDQPESPSHAHRDIRDRSGTRRSPLSRALAARQLPVPRMRGSWRAARSCSASPTCRPSVSIAAVRSGDDARRRCLFAPDGHRIRASPARGWPPTGSVEAHCRPTTAPRTPSSCGRLPIWRTWLPEGSWPRFQSDAAHRDACLEALLRKGFVLLHGVPVEDRKVLEVAAGFGYVRHTNYGDLFEVRVEEQAANLAFTSLPIRPHTDNPYRDPVPTIQLLHCLRNAAGGGDSGWSTASTRRRCCAAPRRRPSTCSPARRSSSATPTPART